jgi:glutathione S-transferase
MTNTRNSGITPNELGQPYTIPAVKLDSSTYIQDSAKIASELEKRYPEPSLHLDSPFLPEAYAAVGNILKVIRLLLGRKVLSNILNERSVQYMTVSRADFIKKSREEYANEAAIEEVWKNLKGPLEILAALCSRNTGPFVMGNTRKSSPH